MQIYKKDTIRQRAGQDLDIKDNKRESLPQIAADFPYKHLMIRYLLSSIN